MNRFKMTLAGGIAAALAVGLIACGGSDDEETTTEASFDDAQVEFAQCMRDNGVDFPDPEPGQEGPAFITGNGEVDTESPEYEAASEECIPIIQDAVPEGELPDQAELEDQLLTLTQCLREKGFDIPDPEVGDIGGGAVPTPPDELLQLQDDPDFQAATEECQEETGVSVEGPGAG